MKRFWITLLLCLSGVAVAAGITGISGKSSVTGQQEEIKATDNGLWSFGQLLAGEDTTNSVFRVEQQFSFAVDDADLVVKDEPGFLHSVWCYPEDTPSEAGRVRITNTTAAGGAETTEVWGMEFTAATLTPVGAVLDIVMTTGIVIDFTTTADVKCGVSYR